MTPFYPKFSLSSGEIRELLSWILNAENSGLFADAMMGGKRTTTRIKKCGSFAFPDAAIQLRQRIAKVLGFPEFPAPEFNQGMVASYAFPGDTCFSHTDPRWHDGLWTVHCNVILSAPEKGGDLLVNGKHYGMPLGQPICYPVSELAHETLEVLGVKPRVMWVFGYCVPPEIYENARKANQ